MKNCKIVEQKYGYSYDVLICYADHQTKQIMVDATFYSKTTSCHKTKLLQHFAAVYPDYTRFDLTFTSKPRKENVQYI